MKAVIPMAGSGTRLRPLTYSKPKALLHVGSKPIISHIVDTLAGVGCTHLVPIISHDGVNIPRFITENHPGITVEPIVQDEPLGLGHAVSLARDHVRGGELIVMYGDTIIDGDFSGLVDPSADGVIAVKEVADPRRFGVVEHADGRITRFVEKPAEPRSNLAIVGLNYFRSADTLFEALDAIIARNVRTKGEFQITDAFQLMVENGLTLKPLAIEGWFDAGTPATLLETNRYMLARDGNRTALEGSIIVPPVFIHDDARVTDSVIGPNVSIGGGALIERSIITDSIIGSGAHVKNASLDGSLIGDNARVIDRSRVLFIGDNSSLDFEGGGE